MTSQADPAAEITPEVAPRSKLGRLVRLGIGVALLAAILVIALPSGRATVIGALIRLAPEGSRSTLYDQLVELGPAGAPVLLGLAIDQTRGWTVPEDPATFTKRMQVSDASGYLARSAIRSDEVFQAVAEAFANDAPLAATLPPMLAVAQNEFLKAKTGRTPTRQAPIADALAARLCHPDFDGRELQILAEASLELLTDKTGPWTRTPPEWAMKAPFPEAPTGPIWSPSLTQCLASLRAALGDRLVVSQGVLDHPPFQAARPVATSESVGMTALRLPARIEMVLPLTVSGEPPALPSLQRTGVLPILLHFRGREVFVISRGEAAEQLVDWARARPAGASREDSEAAK